MNQSKEKKDSFGEETLLIMLDRLSKLVGIFTLKAIEADINWI